MFSHSPLSNRVHQTHLVRLLGVSLVIGLLSLSALLLAPQAIASPRAPEAPQPAHSEMLGLSDFGVKVTKNGSVLLHWETGSEMSILGFNVWKRAGKGEWQKLNADMIPALSTGQVVGNAYQLRDRAVKRGKAYFYQLEVVSTDGYSAYTDVVKVKIK